MNKNSADSSTSSEVPVMLLRGLVTRWRDKFFPDCENLSDKELNDLLDESEDGLSWLAILLLEDDKLTAESFEELVAAGCNEKGVPPGLESLHAKRSEDHSADESDGLPS